eukprot:TRINITY_DN6409_c0_g1_i1.p1 TRINITY_DN6409_c0_g1~~TRINITY_DN6409_c0_g1_i1.p1  ORF type:complete len:285 (+),score=47.63 TRINITY_DN6409_c0_g1_i1:67-855(+)
MGTATYGHDEPDEYQGHRLVQVRLKNIMRAPAALQQELYDQTGKRCVPVIFRPDRPWTCCTTEVPDGFKAIAVGYSGKYEGIWPSGLMVHSPGKHVAFLVPASVIVYSMPVRRCPTKDNVMIEIRVSFMMHINMDEESLLHLCWGLGAANLDKIIRTVTYEHVRVMARSISIWEAYDVISGHVVVKETIDALNERLAFYGIGVDSMAIESIRIPDEFAQLLSKATQWNVLTKFEYRNYDFALLKIRNNGDQALETIRAKNNL